MRNVRNHSAVSSRQGPTQSDGRMKASNAFPDSRADVPIFGQSLLTVPDQTRTVTHRDRTAHLGLALCSPNSLCSRELAKYKIVTTGSPRRSGQRTEVVRRSERSRLQRTESSVAAHTAARESRSAGIKTEQAREEGDAPDREQQRDSCRSWATSVGFGQGVGHLPVSIT